MIFVVEGMERPETGEEFTATIKRKSQSGNGLIEVESGHVNVGPIRDEYVGEEVTAEAINGQFARVKDSDARVTGYESELQQMLTPSMGGRPDIPTVGLVEFCDNCGSIMRAHEGAWNCSSCDYTKPKDSGPIRSAANEEQSSADTDDTDTETGQTSHTERSTASKPDIGETFTAEIDRISENGNGIIQLGTSQINLGPIRESAVGEEVTARLLDGTYAEVKSDDVKAENYFEEMRPHLEDVARESHDVSATGQPRFCRACGAVLSSEADGETCSECKQTENQDTAEQSDTGDERRDPEDERDLRELRDAAQSSAVENVPTDGATVSRERVEYNRSAAVKRYVKARADGHCEGCGDPAPFTSKTGEPYLHAHHVNELSDGGSDTVDTVIALCPNCHYRVHDGADGERYNERLQRILQAIER